MASKKPPWKDIPDTNLLPAGAYQFSVKEMTEVMSKGSDSSKPKLMYQVQLKVEEPKEYKGLVVFDRFTVGTEDDPEANDPETWKGSIAARRLKSFVKALAIELGDDMDDTMEAAEGQKGIAMVAVEGKRQGKDGRTYNESNTVTAYYAIGTPGMMPGVTKAGAPTPAAPAMPKKVVEKSVVETKAVTEKVQPKKVVKAEVTTCPICGKDDVPRTEFILHVNQHTGEEEEATE